MKGTGWPCFLRCDAARKHTLTQGGVDGVALPLPRFCRVAGALRSSLISAGALTLIAVALQVARANGHLSAHAWALAYVWGGAGVLWIAWLILAIRDSTQNRRQAAPATSPLTVPQAPQENRASLRPSSHARPNLVFAGTRTIRIGFDALDWRELFFESQKDADPPGVVACFRNEPVPETPGIDADGVRAQMIYRDKDGRELGIVPRACWLQDYFDMVDFPAGASHCVILAILRPGGRLVAPWRRRATFPSSHGGQVVTTEAYQFDERVRSIEMRIMDASNLLLLPPLTVEFSVVDGSPTAVRRS